MSRNFRYVSGIGIVIVALLVLGWWTRQSSAPAAVSAGGSGGGGVLTAAQASYDFGAVSMRNGKVQYQFTLQNDTDQPATVTKLYTSCMCTTARLVVGNRQTSIFGMPGHGFIPRLQEVVAAGGTATVEITFDPNAHGPAGIGHIERAITVEQSGSAPVQLRIAADVTP